MTHLIYDIESDHEIQERHLKYLYRKSKHLPFLNLELSDPSEDQNEWFEHRMEGDGNTWKIWSFGHYFGKEQKKEMGLTDTNIESKRMK